eukprot:3589156-Pleurochrysis_carterae.AAC.2
MPIEGVYSISGRGTVITGRVETGCARAHTPDSHGRLHSNKSEIYRSICCVPSLFNGRPSRVLVAARSRSATRWRLSAFARRRRRAALTQAHASTRVHSGAGSAAPRLASTHALMRMNPVRSVLLVTACGSRVRLRVSCSLATLQTTITGVEMFHKLMDYGEVLAPPK